MFTPPYSNLERAESALAERGYVLLDSSALARLAHSSASELASLESSWNALADDAYLKDGGRYRKRRHSCFVLEGDALTQAAHRAHWQSVDYNALHGGMQRWFEPVEPQVVQSAAWQGLLKGFGSLAEALKPSANWAIEAHQFRIDTAGGIGRPTPEGAHRDGVDLVAVVFVGRSGVKGGETRIFDADGPSGQRFTLTEAWSALVLNDATMIHETTPIMPLSQTQAGRRDTLVLTYRAAGFMGE
jgi:hypothetical protein